MYNDKHFQTHSKLDQHVSNIYSEYLLVRAVGTKKGEFQCCRHRHIKWKAYKAQVNDLTTCCHVWSSVVANWKHYRVGAHQIYVARVLFCMISIPIIAWYVSIHLIDAEIKLLSHNITAPLNITILELYKCIIMHHYHYYCVLLLGS